MGHIDGGNYGTGDKEVACVDQWLTERRLDPFGGAKGTMYAGGTPLFDERTGERRERLEYVYNRQPDAQKACRTGGVR